MARMREIAAVIVIILISISSTTSANKRLDLDLYGESATPRNGREFLESIECRFFKPNGSRCKRRFTTRLNSCLKCEILVLISAKL